MLSPAFLWRIQNLTSSLTKKNIKVNQLEINQMAASFAENGPIVVISALLDDIEFKEQKPGGKDSQKILALAEEVIKYLRLSNFSHIICQAVEGGSRLHSWQQNPSLCENFVSSFCRTLKLPANHTVAVALALTKSNIPAVSKEALWIVRIKLPEFTSIEDVTEELLHGLLYLISTREDFAAAEVCAPFISMITSSEQASTTFAPLLQRFNIKRPSNAAASPLRRPPTSSRISIAAVLQEYGCKCSTSIDILRRFFVEVNTPVDELQLAELIIMTVLQKQVDPSTSYAPTGVSMQVLHSLIRDGEERARAEQTKEWNLEVVVETLKPICAATALNWSLVVRYLDQPQLRICSENEFQILVKVVVLMSGKPFPADGLFLGGNVWSNKAGQLALLILGANLPRNMMDFSSLYTIDRKIDLNIPAGVNVNPPIPSPPNYSWMCLPLYTSLMELASGGMAAQVMEGLSVAANMYPEYVTIGLALVQDTSSGVRSDILRHTLPLFTGLTGSRPASLVMMKRLAEANSELFVVVLRIALRRCNSIQDFLETDSRIKAISAQTGSAAGDIAQNLEDGGSLEELLGYWCILAEKREVDLEEKIKASLAKTPQSANTFFAYCKQHVENLRPAGSSQGGVLSTDNFNLLMGAVQAHPTVVPVDQATAVMEQAFKSAAHSQKPATQQPAKGSPPTVSGNPENNGTGGAAAEDIEEEGNAYFQRIYTSALSIPDVIQLLKQFKTSSNVREQEVFRCMIHNLFDEYRFFHRYPERELQVTGRLFGALIQHQLVSSITLGIALRYVLEALRKDPEAEGVHTNEKMFRFGIIALDQFRPRLSEWPQYCSHLIQIPHLRRLNPEVFAEAQGAIGGTLAAGAPSVVIPNSLPPIPDTEEGSKSFPSYLPQPVAAAPAAASTLPADAPPSQPSASAKVAEVSVARDEVDVISSPPANVTLDAMIEVNVEVVNAQMPTENIRDQIHFIVNNIGKNNAETKSIELRDLLKKDYFNWFANYLVVKRISTQPNFHSLYMIVLDTINSPQLEKTVMNSSLHNVTKLLQSSKITSSSSERSLLRNLGMWLGQMTLAKNKVLLQRRIDLKELLYWGFETGRLIAVCSFVVKIVEGARDSKIFKPPNPWLMALLGVMRELNDIEDLKMNIKFEVQVLCKGLNIKMEDIPRGNSLSKRRMPVKNSSNPDFNIKASSAGSGTAAASPVPAAAVPPTPPLGALLPHPQTFVTPNTSSTHTAPDVSDMNLLPPAAAANPSDFENMMSIIGANSANNFSLIASNTAAYEQTVIPNLSSYVVVNPSLQFFTTNPQHRRLVFLAIDKAIREVLIPVVERSVSIAVTTTKQLIIQDFAQEPNEQLLKNTVQLMISNLAGSLALTTCKEALRVSIGNQLRAMFAQVSNDMATIEQIIQVCSNDNLDLGCMLIEKAATERAVHDMDEALAPSILTRHKYKEMVVQLQQSNPNAQIPPFVDTSSLVDASLASSRSSLDLPEMLKPKANGLHPQQLVVYEGFQRQRPASSSSIPSPPRAATAADDASKSASNASFTMSQTLEMCQHLLARLDMVVKNVMHQAQGREVTMSVLGQDHEIHSMLREFSAVSQRTQSNVRAETASTFAESMFKRLVEITANLPTPDVYLRMEIMVSLLNTLKETCGGDKQFSTTLLSWLGQFSTYAFNVADEVSRNMHRALLVLLIKFKLLSAHDMDTYLSNYMDGGNNMFWVELALSFVRQCLENDLASIMEFTNIFDTVSRSTNAALKKQVQKWISDLRALSAANDEKKATAGAAAAASKERDMAVRDHVTALLERWLRVWNSNNDQLFGQFLQLMHQHGVLKTEEAADRFFRVSTELCVHSCLKNCAAAAEATPPAEVSYVVVDALAKLFLLLVRLADKDAGDVAVRVNLLSRILNAVTRCLMEDHEKKKNLDQSFDQRPYTRLFSSLMQDFGVGENTQEPNSSILPLLNAYAQVYQSLQPSIVPGFAFGWLQLISHPCFMPHVLLSKDKKGWPLMHRLLISLLLFLQPHLKTAQFSEPIKKLLKGTLRILLVLLHDFPQFLCENHLSFCDAIPQTCVQMRNLVLSAFPSNTRLPDPFTPNLKVDTLPEISQQPHILTDFVTPLSERGLKQHIDVFMATRQPAEFLTQLPSVFIFQAEGLQAAPTYNVALLTLFVVYLGAQGSVQLQNKVAIQHIVAYEILRSIVTQFSGEGTYLVLNVMANQLRYPNSHTYFFSCAMLSLFADVASTAEVVNPVGELIQEQITRVLLERLIVQRPHPWGLLITFMELIKNPRYSFWKRPFIHCAPEIERVLESVSQSCGGAVASASAGSTSAFSVGI